MIYIKKVVGKFKFFNEQYEIELPQYNKKEKKLLIVGDIHYHERVPISIFKNLRENVLLIKPDFIIIPGDLIETNAFLDNEESKSFFEELLFDISKNSIIIMSAGNHEIANFNKKRERGKTNKTIEWLEELSQRKIIYFLNNKKVTIDGITFIGFTPSLDYYFNYNESNSESIAYKEYENSGLHMNKSDFNILVSHAIPLDYADKDITDLVISGHWHDGYIPKVLDCFFKNTDKGLFFLNFPKKRSTRIKYARGVKPFGRGYSITTQGYRKHSADIFLFNIMERLAANDVETITIKHGNKLNVIKKE